MQCETIMKRDVKCLSPKDTAQQAARMMRDENIGFLPICDQSKKVLGTLTDRDIVIRLEADGKPASTAVEEAMTREVVACLPKDDVQEALRLMSQHKKSRILVLDDGGRLVGILSLSDMAQYDSGGRAADALREITEREARA